MNFKIGDRIKHFSNSNEIYTIVEINAGYTKGGIRIDHHTGGGFIIVSPASCTLVDKPLQKHRIGVK